MQKTAYLLTFICVVICSSLNAGLPLTTSTTLPAPANFDAADKNIIMSIMKLPVYRDSEDPNQYHYVAPFRLYTYREGVGSMLINIPKSDNVYMAEKNMNKFEEAPSISFEDYPPVIYKRRELAEEKQRSESNIEEFRIYIESLNKISREKIERALQMIAKIEEKYLEATLAGNTELIEKLEKMIKNKEKEIYDEKIIIKDNNLDLEIKIYEESRNIKIIEKELADLIGELSRGYMIDRLNPILVPIASAGIAINTSSFATIDAIKDAAKEALEQLKKSHGGTLTLNLYTGFTEQELRDLSFYKNKYMPNLRISLLNAEDLLFVPLTYLQSVNGDLKENVMFKNITGEGGYHGATINFDLTVDGASILSQNLAAFVLPVGIRAKVTHQMIPFKANLKCDFENGFKLKGRTDVRDGLVIYDNDITQQIRFNDVDSGACKIEMISGDRNSALLVGMQVLKEKLESANMKQTQLSAIESQQYYHNMLLDIDSNRRNTKDDHSWLDYAVTFGTPAVAAGVLSRAAEFHWHTNIQDVEKIRSIKFSTEISLNGYEEKYTGVPTRLCMFYNPFKYGYDRCNEEQEGQTNTYIDARKHAENSSLCKDSQTPSECGRKRAAEAEDLRPPQSPRVPDNLSGGRELF